MVDINKILPDQTRADIVKFNPGDHVSVQVRVVEGDKERIQTFEGDVLSIRGEGSNRTFTVRKISSGVGVERIFPINSPKIAKIEVLKEGNVRRAKLYYLRNLSGKAARIRGKEA
jgi:large subunit ribosomal protein L19